jgi:hypothetical protein
MVHGTYSSRAVSEVPDLYSNGASCARGRWVFVAIVALLGSVVAGLLVPAAAFAMVARWPSQGAEEATRTASVAEFAGTIVDLGAGHSYPGYDNEIFDDCVAATVGDFIVTSFDTTPSTSDITGAFFYAGGTRTEGLSWPQLVDYWSSSHIDGTTLKSWIPLQGSNLEGQVQRWLEYGGIVGTVKGQQAVIDMVDLPANAVVNGGVVNAGNHMWLIVGYTPTAAVVVSWGSEFEVSWANLLAWSTVRDGWGGFDALAVSR